MMKVIGSNRAQYYGIDLGVVTEVAPAVPEGPKNRYERLENRIGQRLGLVCVSESY